MIAGVDEAGRGPLAGPVVAAAVILCEGGIAGLDDSKKLSAKRRAELEALILSRCIVGIGMASVEEIDRINILQATFLAMTRAVEALPQAPAHVLVDGNRLPKLEGIAGLTSAEAIVKGDAKVAAISAASILAKTVRDHVMVQLDRRHPEYGFAIHKGYPTAAHLAALRAAGVSSVHRRSYGPVRSLLR